MKIKEILNKKRLISFEFFPPKTPEGEIELFNNIKSLEAVNPDFVSVTYGAGGSTREKTQNISKKIHDDEKLSVMSHLTCVGHTKAELHDILAQYKKEGIDNILALRGDMPQNLDAKELKSDFTYAHELVSFIKSEFGDYFSVGCAAFPELHPESPNMDWEMRYYKEKVEKGVDFSITQLFFNNEYYYRFLDKSQNEGVNIPVIPGIMPITNFKQIKKFASMCQATIPDTLVRKMEEYEDDNDAVEKIGIEYAVEQCKDLLRNGVPGLHFYTLNKSKATMKIYNEIKGEL